MTMRSRTLALLCCVVLTTAISPAVGQAEVAMAASVPAPPTILLAGDSITQEFDGDFTWRYRLWQEFARQHAPVDFVGPRRFPAGGSNHYLASGWDTDHGGTAGTLLATQVRILTDGQSRITRDMELARPDVLVAFYGTNDLLHGHSVERVIQDWRTYIAAARAVRPDVKIVIAEVTTRRAADRNALNAAVRALAVELTEPLVSPVVVVDVDYAGWNPARHTYDGVHPTSTGETVIAQRVGMALDRLGVLPSAPQAWRWSVAWTPDLRATVRVSRADRLVMGWRDARQLNRATAVRIRITDVRTGRSTTTDWLRRTNLTTNAKAPGRYRVSVQARRQAMVSTWGPLVGVKV